MSNKKIPTPRLHTLLEARPLVDNAHGAWVETTHSSELSRGKRTQMRLLPDKRYLVRRTVPGAGIEVAIGTWAGRPDYLRLFTANLPDQAPLVATR